MEKISKEIINIVIPVNDIINSTAVIWIMIRNLLIFNENEDKNTLARVSIIIEEACLGSCENNDGL